MKVIDILRLSFGNLRRNMLRTILTVSGVVVGIGAIVFLVSLGFGLQELAVSKVANLDALTLLTINPSQKENTLLNSEAVDKFKAVSGVTDVSPILSYSASISSDADYGDTIAYGVNPKYFELEDVTADYGSKTFSGDNANETIISVASLKALKLTDPAKALGKELTTKIVSPDKKAESTLKLKIIGISKDVDTKFAYTPIKTLDRFEGGTYSKVKAKIKERSMMPEIRKAVESMGYPTNSVTDTVDQINQVFTIVKIVLGGFGFIALMVAAIGIFNTLTIALLERTHEIGVMKAIGGRNSDVALVFTAEASMIGLFGGLLGVSTGWVLGKAINLMINFVAVSLDGPASILFATPLWFASIVVAFAFTVSTVAGILPALRAAKLDPLEALRYE